MTSMSSQTLTVEVWRGADDGHFETFDVARRDHQTVLDVVTEIQRQQDPSLSYRFACRVGVCGSCAMMVNGRARWTCRTHISSLDADTITIEPLANMPKIKDLAADMTGFIDKWGDAGAGFTSARTRHDSPAPVDTLSRARKRADAAIECINCGVCHASCDVVKWNDDYLGPAALNRAWSLVNDERHTEKTETLAAALGPGGCSNCHSQGNCMTACPIGLSPTRSIAGLKKMSLLAMVGITP
ncbi:MAG: succinate dehydrogenase/fumarate reductase iron-sulfur subunit [Alphaproteobacteria bacterium]|nr:succinate dehydrogenase/fumarate reductase iron-sulfur subunit [Alphaproteobacteria bacterium]